MAMPPIIFMNIGWMIKYAGMSPDDPTLGGHAYLKNNIDGHEAWNFSPFKTKVYGYVPSNIDITNLGGKSSDQQVDGVTVVSVARNPRDRKTYIDGWYKNATVYNKNSFITLKRAKGLEVGYQVVAPEDQVTLLLPDRRLFHIPTAKEKGNLGQKSVWYGGTDEFRNKTLAYIQSGGLIDPVNSKKTGTPKQPDPEARKLIELAAVKHATDFYTSVEGGSRSVHSVERDREGWDLTVTALTGAVLKVEVKGLTGNDVIVELTPNEYKKMRSLKHRAEYVIYIVTEAGTAKAKSHVFLHNQEASKGGKLVWATADGRILKIEPLIAARLSAPS